MTDQTPTETDPRWLAAMRISEARACDVCASPEGRYSGGRPGHFTTCRPCTIAGLCMTCGSPLVNGRCSGDGSRHTVAHDPAVLEKTSSFRGGAALPDTVRHVRWSHPSLAAHLESEPDVHEPGRAIGRLEKLSQTYLSDMHEAAHEGLRP